ncbi:MAG: hypothetical protein QE263_02530 [Vampirovibrionales bacterium]|nr:hypothetical protein [Vampirovibrionales bacterium]
MNRINLMGWGKDFIAGVGAARRSKETIVLLKGVRLKNYTNGKKTFERLHHEAAVRANAVQLGAGPVEVACIGLFGPKYGPALGKLFDPFFPG